MLEKIFWLGHSTVRIDTEPVIYIDPWKVKKPKRAGLVLISHSHYDHLSAEDVKKIAGPDTVILSPGFTALAPFGRSPRQSSGARMTVSGPAIFFTSSAERWS